METNAKALRAIETLAAVLVSSPDELKGLLDNHRREEFNIVDFITQNYALPQTGYKPKSKERGSYSEARNNVRTDTLSETEYKVLSRLIELGGEATTKVIVNEDINQNKVNGSLSMLTAKGFVVTERKHAPDADAPSGTSLQRVVVITDAGIAMQAGGPKKGERVKKEGGAKTPGSGGRKVPQWATATTVEAALNAFTLTTEDEAALRTFAGEYGGDVPLSAFWKLMVTNTEMSDRFHGAHNAHLNTLREKSKAILKKKNDSEPNSEDSAE